MKIVTIDFETYYGTDYTLKKLSTTSYIRDPRFKVHLVGVKVNGAKTHVIPEHRAYDALRAIDWKNSALLAHHCVPGDVEVLTRDGWQRLDTLPDTATVMQWCPQTEDLSWASANKVVRSADSLLQWDTSFHRCSYTEHHRMFYATPRVSAWRATSAADVAVMSPNNTYIPLGGVFTSDATITLTSEEAVLMEAIRADGSWRITGEKCYGARFKLSKARKIERLVSLLSALDVAYSRTDRPDGATVVNIGTCELTRRIYDLLGREKAYGLWVLDLSVEAREAILTDARYWDGHTKTGGCGYVWSCADEQTVEAFQMMAHATGWSISGAWRDNCRGYSAHLPYARLYVATVRHKRRAKLVKRAVRVPHDGPVYCVTVPTGAFLARSKDRVFVTGNCHFDAFILTHHFGCYPAMYLDTLSMARAICGVDVRNDLDALAKRFGFGGKVRHEALANTKGKQTLTREEYRALAAYCADDVDDTYKIFLKLKEFLPDEELRVIDITLRAYAEPRLIVDAARVKKLYDSDVENKRQLLEKAGVSDPKDVSSPKKFAALLESFGVDPPMKPSPTAMKKFMQGEISFKELESKTTYAFAQNDLAFQELQDHPLDAVQALVEARLAVKSTLVETRAAEILSRAGRPTPIYLKHWGARTGRWSGGDKANWQNLPRGSELRKSLQAPKNHKLIISDSSQIEARLNAWKSGQWNKIDAFARGDDVYCLTASDLYGFPVNKDTNPNERFVGKVFELGGGYGAGAAKMNRMFKSGQFGPPIDMPLEETEFFLSVWRSANSAIVRNWKTHQKCFNAAYFGSSEVECGCVTFEVYNKTGYIHLPNGTFLQYPNIRFDEDENQLVYIGRNSVTRLWGGLIVENVIQALARVVIAHHLVLLADTLPETQLVMTTHDEGVWMVPEKQADSAYEVIHATMCIPPDWAEGLPLDAETKISTVYDKS